MNDFVLMAGARRWNYHTRRYEPYTLPDGAIIYSEDMDAECTCAACGKLMKFGDGYTSMEIHNPMGTGYSVCADCHELERDRRLADVEARYDREAEE